MGIVSLVTTAAGMLFSGQLAVIFADGYDVQTMRCART
jgi:hypothetical protein